MSALPLAVTMGEPAGVGPELVGQAWLARETSRIAPFYCAADPQFLEQRLAEAGISAPIEKITAPGEAPAAYRRGLPVLPLKAQVGSGNPGAPSPLDSAAVLEAIETAVANVIEGEAAALVTAPVQKETLYAAGFAFPGHTEFLGDLARRRGYEARPVMMIASDALRVVPVTIHIPISMVPGALTRDEIVDTGTIVDRELKARFGIAAPRLAVSGLNPHAGEGGQIGTEERDIIAPAVDELRAAGIDVSGPLAADTMFHPAARARYDVAICMYHDQALIPVKTVAFDTAVNVTLGLPFVRTSPDHGTALSLAGSGKADPTSFIAAIGMAARLSAANP